LDHHLDGALVLIPIFGRASGSRDGISNGSDYFRSSHPRLWASYGFVIWSIPVLIFSAVGLLLCSTTLALKVLGNRNLAPEPAKQVT
jgi:hypothetical protein